MLTKLISLLLTGIMIAFSTPITDNSFDKNGESEVPKALQEIINKLEHYEGNEGIRIVPGEDTIRIQDDLVLPPEEPVDEIVQEFSDAVTDFSEKLYAKVTAGEEEKKNMILSPLSAIYALSLVSNGAEGDTLDEFEKLFGNIPVDQMNDYLCNLTARLSQSKDSKVVVGNSVWVNKSRFTLSDEFISLAKRYYDAEARSVAFNQSTVKDINNWVSKKTDGMIDNVISEIDPRMALMLLNTVLFDGKWETEYADKNISNGKFTNADGTKSDVKFLYSKETAAYFAVKGGVGFSKEYKDGYKFTAVLPSGNVDEFIANMDLAAIIDASKNSREDVITYIPKFEYEFGADFTNILKSMGLNTAFTNAADFDKLAASGQADAKIDAVFQKAKVILNEHGTKAAAVTVVTVYGTTAIPRQPKTVRLDRPFFYIIQDANGIPLFMGTVYSLAS